MTLSLMWSFIMAGGIVLGLSVFLFLVVRADRRRKQPQQESTPAREVIGGRFDAPGGRQVMPHRDAPPAETPLSGPSSQH